MASILKIVTCVLLAVVLQPDGTDALKCHQPAQMYLPFDKKEVAPATTDDCAHPECTSPGYKDENQKPVPVCYRIRYETGNKMLGCGRKGICMSTYQIDTAAKDGDKKPDSSVKTCEECTSDYCFKDGATSVAANLVLSMISLFVVYFAKRMA